MRADVAAVQLGQSNGPQQARHMPKSQQAHRLAALMPSLDGQSEDEESDKK
ncbi:MAG: hypothetical protein IJU37_05945 [Desulfovibrio sp.]|nr:hypothetical protein [Desulfovibrio sp.]